MKHMKYCMEHANQKKLEDAIKLKNFKRRIEESPEKAKDDVRHEYERIYHKKLRTSDLIWKNNMLYDLKCQQVRLVFKNKPILIPPIGCVKTVKYPYKKYYFLDSLPSLNTDVMIKIFSYIPGWELISLRFVCKEWNHIIVNTNSLWKVYCSRCPDEWVNLSSFKLYIKHMFLNYRKQEVIQFLNKHRESFFVYMCGLLLGHKNLKILIDSNEITVNLYKLTRNELYYNEKPVNLNLFLDAYRQSIL